MYLHHTIPSLQDFVIQISASKWYDNVVYYARANGSLRLIFCFKESTNSTLEFLYSSVHGQTHEFGKYPARNNILVICVELYPYVTPYLFDIAPTDLMQKMIFLDNLPKKPFANLNERLARLNNIHEGIAIITDYLKQRLRPYTHKEQHIANAVRYIKTQNGHINISDLAGEFFLSQKQFERRFKETSGFNPKLYARIARFESSIKNFYQHSSLTKVAHATGYYDQAHYIHDFKKFTGFSPRQYFSLVKA